MARFVRRGEDQLLWPYARSRGGRLWQEVWIPVDGKGKKRRIDGVLAPDPGTPLSRPSEPVDWKAIGLEVIEVKAVLNEEVIGQVAAARLEAALLGDRAPESVSALVLVGEAHDRDLLYVCGELDIRVEVEKACVVLSVPFLHDDAILASLQRL
ncbi:MAG: hypothetical protein QOD39_1151, partial [Mycobacterium sp.]|nr:hypothetical protein [Mycobacterium sp.]